MEAANEIVLLLKICLLIHIQIHHLVGQFTGDRLVHSLIENGSLIRACNELKKKLCTKKDNNVL